jgi:hypothetical protein
MPSAGGAAGPVTEATKPCPLHPCRRRACLITDKVPAVTSRPALRPGATKRSWPVAPIAGLAGRRILRLTAPPHLSIGHHRRRGSSAQNRTIGVEAAGWPDPGKARGEALAAAFRVGLFWRQAQAVCRAYTWPASSGPPRVLAAARAAPVRADPRSSRLEALTDSARMPGLGRGPGADGGSCPQGPAVARPGRHFAPGPVPGSRGDGQAWS